jgi:hypothetical protein
VGCRLQLHLFPFHMSQRSCRSLQLSNSN